LFRGVAVLRCCVPTCRSQAERVAAAPKAKPANALLPRSSVRMRATGCACVCVCVVTTTMMTSIWPTLYTILPSPIVYSVWDKKGRSVAGRTLRNGRAIVLQQGGRCRWAEGNTRVVDSNNSFAVKQYLVKAKWAPAPLNHRQSRKQRPQRRSLKLLQANSSLCEGARAVFAVLVV